MNEVTYGDMAAGDESADTGCPHYAKGCDCGECLQRALEEDAQCLGLTDIEALREEIEVLQKILKLEAEGKIGQGKRSSEALHGHDPKKTWQMRS